MRCGILSRDQQHCVPEIVPGGEFFGGMVLLHLLGLVYQEDEEEQ